MTVYLKDLYFGNADGDTESNKKDFLDLFYKGNNKYDELVDNPMKFIIYGQKGTGKTILGRYIEKTFTSKGIYCRVLNKDDIMLEKMLEKKNGDVSDDELIHLFKWIIYHEIYKIAENVNINCNIKCKKQFIEQNKKIWKYKKNIKKLRKIFKDRYPDGNYEDFGYEMLVENETEGSLEIAVGKLNNGKIFGRKKYAQNKKYIKKEFYKVIAEVEMYILECLRNINIAIILDDLDELDICLKNDSSAKALNKLIDAFKNINLMFANDKDINSKCFMLIRSDIIEELNKRSSNLNKIISDNSVELYWIDNENQYPENHMLMEMILNKIRRTCEEYKGLSNRELYNKLFPEEINNKSIINHLINNSFGRPRDIICYLEIVKRKYPNEENFIATMFKECKQEYSDAFLKELYNEMKIHLPVENVDDYINLIRNFGKISFFRKDLLKYYKPRSKSYKNITNIDEVLRQLYRFGVVGNLKKCSNSKCISIWGYRKDGNRNANLDQKFSIHYGLRKVLNVN